MDTGGIKIGMRDRLSKGEGEKEKQDADGHDLTHLWKTRKIEQAKHSSKVADTAGWSSGVV